MHAARSPELGVVHFLVSKFIKFLTKQFFFKMFRCCRHTGRKGAIYIFYLVNLFGVKQKLMNRNAFSGSEFNFTELQHRTILVL